MHLDGLTMRNTLLTVLPTYLLGSRYVFKIGTYIVPSRDYLPQGTMWAEGLNKNIPNRKKSGSAKDYHVHT